jgi:hypothetical protein
MVRNVTYPTLHWLAVLFSYCGVPKNSSRNSNRRLDYSSKSRDTRGNWRSTWAVADFRGLTPVGVDPELLNGKTNSIFPISSSGSGIRSSAIPIPRESNLPNPPRQRRRLRTTEIEVGPLLVEVLTVVDSRAPLPIKGPNMMMMQNMQFRHGNYCATHRARAPI